MEDDDLDIPRYSYAALGLRWDRSPWTIKSWVAKGRLSKPHYLSANAPRFTERQVREYERNAPRDWKLTQTNRKVIRTERTTQ